MASVKTFEFRNDRYNILPSLPHTLAILKKRKKLIEVTIKVGSESLVAHLHVLAVAIPYFKAVFRSKMIECEKREVTMKGIDYDALICIIRYAYTNHIRIPAALVQPLLETAVYLQVDCIAYACLSFLAADINFDNALMFRVWAYAADDLKAMGIADRYVCENFREVSKSADFVKLPLPTLKEIIERHDLHVMHEDEVLEAAIKWVVDMKAERAVHLPELLPYIRMNLLTSGSLVARISDAGLLSTFSAPSESRMVLGERYCKWKHHLKCAERKGSVMYCAITEYDGTFSLKYYDHFNSRWNHIDPMRHVTPEYIICASEKIYFLQSRRLTTLDLRTVESTIMEFNGEKPLRAGIVFHRDIIYLFGGALSTSTEQPLFSSNQVYTLDVQKGKCDVIGCITRFRGDADAVSLGNCIYISGGWDHRTIHNSVENYNPETGSSIEVTPMWAGRCEHGSVSLNGKIYVYGGITCEGSSRHVTHSGEVYDPLSGQWRFIASLNFARNSLHLFAYDSCLYSVGSSSYRGNHRHPQFSKPGRELSSCSEFGLERCDPDTDKWEIWDTDAFPSSISRYAEINILTTNSALRYQESNNRFDTSSESDEFSDSSDETSDDSD